MKTRIISFALAVAAFAGTLTTAVAAKEEPLRLVGRTEIAGYEGDFDHFAADLNGNRLFLAGEEGGTLEVFDLRTGRHVRTVEGLDTPHAIHYMPATDRLIVSDSGDGMSKVLDGKTYAVANTIELTPGADVMSYDASTQRLWIVTGGKNATKKMAQTVLSEIDPSTGKRLGDVSFDSDFTEGIVVEQKGERLFVNIAGKSEIAVLDKKTREVIATWPVREGQNNAPIALDEPNQRLFVVTRKPFKLVVLDTRNGSTVGSFDAPQRTNELMFDPTRGRIYLTGDDYVAVFQRKDPDHYEEIARVPSDKGARTAIYIPELNRLYVAVAGKAPVKAALLQYDVLPPAGK